MRRPESAEEHSLLFIAPLPPPLTGMSLVSAKTRIILESRFKIIPVNLSKNSFKQGNVTVSRLKEIFGLLRIVLNVRGMVDTAYITVSQSIAGNAKDLLLLFLLRKKRVVLHLHGGGIKAMLFDRHPIVKFINRIICRHIEKCLVLGKSLAGLYEGVIPRRKIFVLPNYADNELFVSEREIEAKFSDVGVLKVLYLSNLLPGKGYYELATALLSLERERPDLAFEARFIGDFESDRDKDEFFIMVDGSKSIKYLGVLGSKDKKEYLAKSHVFCLPSYYHFMEGQPLSILEAYASGCAVVSTNHGGIVDIFGPQNGILVEKASANSIKEALVDLCENPWKGLGFALHNRRIVKDIYSEEAYTKGLLGIFSPLLSSNRSC